MYIAHALKRAVQINRSGIATIDGTRQRTWAEFAERVAKLAGVFQGLDLSAGGRVAILALNSDRYLEYFYAVPWGRGIVVLLNIRLAPPELVYMLNDSGAEILIVDDAFQAILPAFSGTLTTVKHVVFGCRRWFTCWPTSPVWRPTISPAPTHHFLRGLAHDGSGVGQGHCMCFQLMSSSKAMG